MVEADLSEIGARRRSEVLLEGPDQLHRGEAHAVSQLPDADGLVELAFDRGADAFEPGWTFAVGPARCLFLLGSEGGGGQKLEGEAPKHEIRVGVGTPQLPKDAPGRGKGSETGQNTLDFEETGQAANRRGALPDAHRYRFCPRGSCDVVVGESGTVNQGVTRLGVPNTVREMRADPAGDGDHDVATRVLMYGRATTGPEFDSRDEKVAQVPGNATPGDPRSGDAVLLSTTHVHPSHPPARGPTPHARTTTLNLEHARHRFLDPLYALNVVTLTRSRRAAVLLLAWVFLGTAACTDLEVGTIVPDPPDFRPEPDPVTVVITPASDTVTGPGATAHFSAVALGPDDQLLQGAVISWRSSNQGVATVQEATGVATAVGPGVALITATAGNVQSDASLVVRPSPQG